MPMIARESSKSKLLKINLAECVNTVYQPLIHDRNRYLVLYGGGASGKSFFAAQKVILRTLAEKPHTFLVLRKVASSCRQSVFKLLRGITSKWGVESLFTINEAEMKLTLKSYGNEIMCKGLDDPEKIKSITGADGMGVSGVWIEEPTELTPRDFDQVDLRLRGDLPNYKQIILSFNPIDVHHWLRERFTEAVADNLTVLKTTYRDNRWATDEDRAVLENLINVDASMHAVYARGEWGRLKGVIYSAWPAAACPGIAQDSFYGLDFGFHNPSALVRCDMHDGAIYVFEELYESGLTTADLAARMVSLGISRRAPIYCDSAEPDRIEEVARAGFNAMPQAKGQGSVNAGILFLKSQRVFLHPDAVNVRKENLSYKWREDKNGEVIDKEPAKFNDHCFVKGTMIATPQGNSPIEDLRVGDLVLTRQGYKPVVACGLTCINAKVREYSFTNGVNFKATEDHPIFSINHGFIPLRSLMPCDTLLSVKGEGGASWLSNRLNIRVSLSDDTQNQGGWNCENIFVVHRSITRSESGIYIMKFGKIILGLFRRNIIFIIKIWIPQTIIKAILNCLHQANMPKFMNHLRLQSKGNFALNTWPIYGLLQKNGMDRKLGISGTRNMELKRIKEEVRNHLYVKNAGKNILHIKHTKTGFAQNYANRECVERQNINLLK